MFKDSGSLNKFCSRIAAVTQNYKPPQYLATVAHSRKRQPFYRLCMSAERAPATPPAQPLVRGWIKQTTLGSRVGSWVGEGADAMGGGG